MLYMYLNAFSDFSWSRQELQKIEFLIEIMWKLYLDTKYQRKKNREKLSEMFTEYIGYVSKFN